MFRYASQDGHRGSIADLSGRISLAPNRRIIQYSAINGDHDFCDADTDVASA